MKAIKIWNDEVNKKDTYLDFKGTFSCFKQGKVLLRLSCDSVFTAYLNNEMVGFGSCANFPKRKLFYTFGLGLGDKDIAKKLKEGKGLVPITLSMNTFFYDALLKVDKNNKEWIIEDIKKKYSYMLKEKATTFWETEKGWKDFDNAGSLCHGWSAMPIYYINELL